MKNFYFDKKSGISFLINENQTDSIPLHFHRTVCFVYQIRGSLELCFNNPVKTLLTPGKTIIIPSLQPHSIKFSVPSSNLVINFPNIVTDNEIEVLIKNYFSNYNDRFRILNEININNLIQKIKNYLATGKLQPTQPIIIDNIINHIYSNPCFFSLDKISMELNLSKFYLSHLFKKEAGISMYEYSLYTKINSSIEMLKENKSIVKTSCLLGFSDQPHFSRLFKKYTGINPGKFLKDDL